MPWPNMLFRRSSGAPRPVTTRTETRWSSTLSSRITAGTAMRPSTPVGRCSPRTPRARWPNASPCLGATWFQAGLALVARRRLPAYRRRTACFSLGVSGAATPCWCGAPGGVATALIKLGRAAGMRVFSTGRTEERRTRALALGAHDVFEASARLPLKVDAVMETVGRATWTHSVRCLRPGGVVVTSGTTSRPDLDDAMLPYIYFEPLSVIGSTMGTCGELSSLVSMSDATGDRPIMRLHLVH